MVNFEGPFTEYPLPSPDDDPKRVTKPQQRIKDFKFQPEAGTLKANVDELRDKIASGQATPDEVKLFNELAGKPGLSKAVTKVRRIVGGGGR